MKREKLCLTLCALAFAVNLSAATRFRAASPADPVIGRYEIVFSETVLDAEAAASELARTYVARIEPFAADNNSAGVVMTMLPERARLMSNDPRVAMVTEIGSPAGVLAGVSAPPRPGVAESTARPTTPQPNAADAWSSGNYAYDAAGNIRSIGVDTYAYDTALRVVAATTENQRGAVTRSQEYAYDSFGNRVSSTTTHKDASRCVDGTLCEENVGVDKKTNRINTNGAEYDAAGNLTRIDAAYSYAYDAVGMLFRQQTPGVTQFVYTAADERIAVYTAGRWEWSVRDHAGKVLRTFTSNDHGNERGTAGFTWTKDYVYRGSLLLASDAPSGRRHYHLDHLGTPRVITDDGGRKLGTHAYHAFGAEVPLSFTEQPQERLKFTGHERDLSPDIHTLDYMHARYYSAAMGRFLSVDPVLDVKRALRSPQLWNRYSYALNNPLVFTDPTGKTVYLVTYTMGNDANDDELRRAAQTRAVRIRRQKGFDPKKDTVLVRGVTTKADFAAAIKEANSLGSTFGKVGGLSMFSHAGPIDGPIFQSGTKNQQQFAISDLSLKSFTPNWEAGGAAYFYGCNTGINFTQNFANAQRVSAHGYEGFASFSGTDDNWSPWYAGGPVYLIQTPGLSNGGIRGMLGKRLGFDDDAIPMDRDDPQP